jgi:RHS repeat-associated protein
VGNITHIQDDAQQTIYFDNAVVEPSNDYVYDALYRLTSAKGRETAQGGEAARDSKEPGYASGFPITNQTLRNYTETYEFDSVGNFVRFRHAIQGDTTNSWTREYRYAFDDPLQSASNRLWQTWTGGNPANATTYDHDPHGNMLNLARTAPRFNMRWDHRDMIGSIDLGGGGWAYYQYDSSKQRTRKYIKRNGGIEERIYLGGYELYRRTVGGEVVEEIESHHLFEGEQRVLFVDDVIIASDVNTHPRPDGLTVNAQTLFRYQYSNHLGSACLELDEQAEIISYEEYQPYGTSAFRAMNDQVEAPPKRYRYTGMERDEESGLNYHGARSYAPWLMRWVSCDPSAFADGVNLYQFVSANPSTRIDRTGRSSQKTGGEVETVRPFLENFARRYSLQYVTEVSFEVNVPGLGSIPGRPDYLFAMPGAKSKRLPPFLFIETKGWNLQDFTENQEIYIPLLTSLRGSQVRLMDNRARRFGLRSGRVLDVNEDSFLVLGRPNMQNFPNAYFQYSSGKTYPYSLVSRSGELKFAETQAEFYALLKQEGINPASLAAPGSGGSIKAGWTSGWKTRVGGTASLGLILYSMLAPSIAEAGVQNQLEEKLQAMDPALGVARTERPNSWAVLQIQYDVDAPPEGITQVVGVRASFRMVPPNQSPLNFIDQLRSIPNLYAGTLYVGHPEASYYLIPPVNMTPGPVMPKN